MQYFSRGGAKPLRFCSSLRLRASACNQTSAFFIKYQNLVGDNLGDVLLVAFLVFVTAAGEFAFQGYFFAF